MIGRCCYRGIGRLSYCYFQSGKRWKVNPEPNDCDVRKKCYVNPLTKTYWLKPSRQMSIFANEGWLQPYEIVITSFQIDLVRWLCSRTAFHYRTSSKNGRSMEAIELNLCFLQLFVWLSLIDLFQVDNLKYKGTSSNKGGKLIVECQKFRIRSRN